MGEGITKHEFLLEEVRSSIPPTSHWSVLPPSPSPRSRVVQRTLFLTTEMKMTMMVYTTGAQEWHIVSLLGDVTSPTTVAHYVTMTSDLRVLITGKYWQTRRQHAVYPNKRLEFATELVGRLRYVTAVDGGLKRFPSVAWFAHPWYIQYLLPFPPLPHLFVLLVFLLIFILLVSFLVRFWLYCILSSLYTIKFSSNSILHKTFQYFTIFLVK